MKRVDYSRQFITASATVLFACGKLCAAEPNIVFILADDMGIGDISGFNEDSKIRTRHLDAMCANGIRFTDAHANSSVSTPSRYGILTGRYAFRTPLKSGTLGGLSEPLIEPDRSTVATMLSKQGYKTACIGKWHLGWNWAHDSVRQVDYSKPVTEGPTTRGFDYFYGIAASLDMPPYVYVENDMPASLPDREAEEQKGLLFQRKGPVGAGFEHEDVLPDLWRRGVKYIEEQKDSDSPFFLYLPITAPHTPVLPTDEYKGRSGLSPYGDFVLMIDDMVGDIVAALKKTGQYDNTMIIFASDNGCAPYADISGMEKEGHFPNYIYRGAKSDLYEGGHRIPLIVSWGDRYDGQTESGLVSLTDLYATFADMTGYAIPDNEAEDSYSMWPVFSGQGKSERKDIVHHSMDGDFAIRDGQWKLLFCAGSGGWGFPGKNAPVIESLPAVQLYDMNADPSEKSNLQAEHPDVVSELSGRMRKYLEDGRSTPGEKQPNAPMRLGWKQTEYFMK